MTIPAKIRKQARMLPHTEVEFVFDGDSVRMVRSCNSDDQERGRSLIDRVRGSATIRMSTDEIIASMRAP